MTSLLKKEMVWLDACFENRLEVFEAVGMRAQHLNLTEETFSTQLELREKEFPTGLALAEYGVAIPHTDAVYVKEPFIGILTLEKPVIFQAMDDNTKEVEVRLVFVLGLAEAHTQLAVLQELMKIIQDKERIKKMLSTQTIEEMLATFHQEDLRGGEFND